MAWQESGSGTKAKILIPLASTAVCLLFITFFYVFKSECCAVPANNGLLGDSSEVSEVEKFTILGNSLLLKGDEEEEAAEPLVRIKGQGRVRGTVLKSRDGRDYFAFYKVPYAAAPVDRLRFEPPKNPRRWRGIWDGTKPGPECIQREKYAPVIRSAGEEDCLFLNIYTPKLPIDRKDSPNLPVMLYIHGGGLSGNGTRYGAKYFMDEQVILITFEYRLGILGTFTTGTTDYPGNLGGRDRIRAMQWVRDNIARFGGDPKRVVIFGNSSGGSYVHELVISPMSAGLFSGAIVESGTSITGDRLIQNPEVKIQQVAESLGCGEFWNNDSSPRRLLRCLRQVPVDDFILNPVQPLMLQSSIEPLPSDQDGDDLSDVYLPDYPWKLIQEGKAHKVPLIIGVNSHEIANATLLSMFFGPDGPQRVEEAWDEVLPLLVGIPDDANHTMARKFYEVYFGRNGSITSEDGIQLVDISSDGVAHATRVSGLAHATTTNESVYFYWLSKDPPKSYGEDVRKFFPKPFGASHADELQYLFLYEGYPEIPQGSPWYAFSKQLVSLWVSFATDGYPKKSPGWEEINPADNGLKWFQLDDEMKIVEPYGNRMELWDEYTEELYPVG